MADLNLTKRQQEIFDFIKKYSAKYGYPPTVRDIGKAIGLTSSSTVHAHLSNLEKIGLLRRDPQAARHRAAVDRAKKAADAVVTGGLPLVGQVAAGRRCSPRRTSRSTCRCPSIAGGDEGEYVLAIKGDSMINAGIHDGDHVVVHPQETAKNGEIVVALVGDPRRRSSASSRSPTT